MIAEAHLVVESRAASLGREAHLVVQSRAASRLRYRRRHARCPVALAPAPVGATSPAFDEGRRLYFDLEYELAVFRSRDAVRDTELAPKDRALALAWLGLAYSQVAEMESAKEAFVEAVRLDPEVALPKDASPPPKALQLLEEARREALAAREPPPPTTAPEEPAAVPPSLLQEGGGRGFGPLLFAGGGVVAGLGVLAVAAGGGLGLLALSAAKEGNAAPFQDDAKRFKDQAESSALFANIAYLAGGALVAVGVAMLGGGLVVE